MNPLNLRTASSCITRTMVSRACAVYPLRIRLGLEKEASCWLRYGPGTGRSRRKESTSLSLTTSPLPRRWRTITSMSARLSSIPPPIKFYDFQTRKITQIGAIEKGVIRGYPGFSVTWDGRYMAWSQVDQGESDLMMIENFR